MADVHFKFRQGADADTQRELIARLRSMGARAVRPLFAKEKDPELAALYRLTCDEAVRARILAALQRDDVVEFAETPPTRRLIR